MRILISAYACEPDRGSEAEIGWGIVLELAKEHQLWVLTRANNRFSHDEFFKKLPGGKPDNLNFIYYDLPSWARFYKKGGRRFLLYYYHWQVSSYFACKKIFFENQIDIVHHLTGGMDFFPSGFSFFKAPFVWGPIGGEDTHPVILESLPIRDKLKEYKRLISRFLLRKFDPFLLFTRYKADQIIIYSSKKATSSHKFYKKFSSKISAGIQTGLILDERYSKRKKTFQRGNVFTIFYAAKLISWKGGRYVIDAFIKLCHKKDVDARLVIVGEGPLETDMKNTIRKAGLDDRVEFKSWVSMQELIDMMSKFDVFLYPTFHHGLANICLQTMVMGLPMICLEGDGVETVLENGGGISVSIDSYESIGDNLADAIYKLYIDEDLRINLSIEAQKNIITNYNYTKLASNLIPVYKKSIELFNDES